MSEHPRGELKFTVAYEVVETSTGLPPEWLELIVQDACYAVFGGDLGKSRWFLGQFHADGTFVVAYDKYAYDPDVEWLGWADVTTQQEAVSS